MPFMTVRSLGDPGTRGRWRWDVPSISANAHLSAFAGGWEEWNDFFPHLARGDVRFQCLQCGEWVLDLALKHEVFIINGIGVHGPLCHECLTAFEIRESRRQSHCGCGVNYADPHRKAP